jgi:hypothetical protein
MVNEPIITVATVTGAVTALLGLFVAFGLDISPDQQTAILGVVAVVAPIVVALIARNFTVAFKRTLAYQTKTGSVVAGEGSELPTGSPVDVSPASDVPLPGHGDLPGDPYHV